jgi:hypothetical protein
MRRIILAGLALLSLSACASLPGMGPPRTAEQRDADRETLALLLQHCELTANFESEIGLSARSGLELRAGGTCKPVALKDFGKPASADPSE